MKKGWVIVVIILVLLVLAVLGFLFTPNNQINACPEDAKLCPDGTIVGRTGPSCEFSPCQDNKNSICGGIAGIQCPDGYFCNFTDPKYTSDAGGDCVKNNLTNCAKSNETCGGGIQGPNGESNNIDCCAGLTCNHSSGTAYSEIGVCI